MNLQIVGYTNYKTHLPINLSLIYQSHFYPHNEIFNAKY